MLVPFDHSDQIQRANLRAVGHVIWRLASLHSKGPGLGAHNFCDLYVTYADPV